MVPFSARCANLVITTLIQVEQAKSILYYYRDQVVFTFGWVEALESLVIINSLLIVGVSCSLLFLQRTVFILIDLPISEAINFSVSLIIIVAIFPLLCLFIKSVLLYIFTDRRLAAFINNEFDSIGAAKAFKIHRSFTCRVRGRATFTLLSALQSRFAMPIIRPFAGIVGLIDAALLRADILQPFAVKLLRAFLWGVCCWIFGKNYFPFSFIPGLLCLSNLYAAAWWILTSSPYKKLYARVRPSEKTLARSPYKNLSVV